MQKLKKYMCHHNIISIYLFREKLIILRRIFVSEQFTNIVYKHLLANS